MIKKINQAIENFFSKNISEIGKARIIANIEKANSKELQWMKYHNQVTVNVIDDMLKDPFWAQVIAEAQESGSL